MCPGALVELSFKLTDWTLPVTHELTHALVKHALKHLLAVQMLKYKIIWFMLLVYTIKRSDFVRLTLSSTCVGQGFSQFLFPFFRGSDGQPLTRRLSTGRPFVVK